MYTAPFHTVCYTLCLKSLFFMGSDCGDYTPCDIICTLSICGKTLFTVNNGELSSLKCGGQNLGQNQLKHICIFPFFQLTYRLE